jgi:hypothetical protein
MPLCSLSSQIGFAVGGRPRGRGEEWFFRHRVLRTGLLADKLRNFLLGVRRSKVG